MNAPVRQGIPLRPDPSAHDREWKRSFVRAATSVVIAKLQKSSAAEIHKANWPDDSRAAVILRGAVSPTTQDAYPGSSVSRLLLLAPTSLAARLFPLATTVDLQGVSSFSAFPLASNFAAAQWVAEGQPISVRQDNFSGMAIGPVKKIGLIGALSSELENASGGIASVAIGNVLDIAITRGLDGKLVSADAETEEAPAGLLFGVAPIAGSADMATDLSALVAEIAAAGIDASSVVFITSAAQALSIALGSGPHFVGRVLGSNAVPDNTIIAVATAGLLIAGDGADPLIDISKQAVLVMSEPASPISTAGAPNVVSAPTVSMFGNDLIALKCIARLCWSAAPGSVAFIEDISWGRVASATRTNTNGRSRVTEDGETIHIEAHPPATAKLLDDEDDDHER